MHAGRDVLAAGAEDRQRPHAEDELYYVVSGSATIPAGGEDRPVGPASLVFVTADLELRSRHHGGASHHRVRLHDGVTLTAGRREASP